MTTDEVLQQAATTHREASALRRPGGWLGWWRVRKFINALDSLAHAMRAVPQSEVPRFSGDVRSRISDLIDAIVEDVEAFIGTQGDNNLKRVERDRHLVRRIYELRAAFEKLSRGVTIEPGMTDLRWEMKSEATHRDRK